MEILALFVSCLCHDLDHRGTNNAFQVSYVSLLVKKYSNIIEFAAGQAMAINRNTEKVGDFDFTMVNRQNFQRSQNFDLSEETAEPTSARNGY